VIGDAMLLRVVEAHRAAGLGERIVCDHGTRHRALGVRVGMHTGTAVQRGADWFGSAVNIASRIADMAQAGEILISGATREALGPAAPLRERGDHRLRNLVEPVPIFELVLTNRGGRLPIDPVCRMAVEPDRAVERRSVDGTEYLFCSEDCAAAFDRDPAAYVPR
jgi:adenylate cyclase